MLSSLLEVLGFVALVVGASVLAGVGGGLIAAGLVTMVVGYVIGEPA